MSVKGASLRTLYESEGPRGFVEKTRALLGITEDSYGRKVLSESREVRPEEIGLRESAVAIMGEDGYRDFMEGRMLDPLYQLELMEAGGGAQLPGHAPNISAWSATISGLLEVKVLEGYKRPQFIADKLARTIPTRQRSEKLPGMADLGDAAETMNPSDPHPRAQMEERYVQTPETQKRGLGVDITKEAVHFDLTNQVLSNAEKVGESLGLRKEKRVLDTVLGVAANSYNYRGTTYATYIASGGNWANQITDQLEDWSDVDAALQKFAEMTDQENGERISVTPTTLLVMPLRHLHAKRILSATEVRYGDTTSATGTQTIANNPLADAYEILTSPIAHQQIVASGVSAANASQYWYLGDFQRAFAYMENWDIQVRRASPDNYTMIDRDLVLSVFTNEMGAPAVIEPREVVRSITT